MCVQFMSILNIYIQGVPYDVVGLIQEKSRKELGVVTSVEHRFMYAWVKSEPPQPAM